MKSFFTIFKNKIFPPSYIDNIFSISITFSFPKQVLSKNDKINVKHIKRYLLILTLSSAKPSIFYYFNWGY